MPACTFCCDPATNPGGGLNCRAAWYSNPETQATCVLVLRRACLVRGQRRTPSSSRFAARHKPFNRSSRYFPGGNWLPVCSRALGGPERPGIQSTGSWMRPQARRALAERELDAASERAGMPLVRGREASHERALAMAFEWDSRHGPCLAGMSELLQKACSCCHSGCPDLRRPLRSGARPGARRCGSGCASRPASCSRAAARRCRCSA